MILWNNIQLPFLHRDNEMVWVGLGCSVFKQIQSKELSTNIFIFPSNNKRPPFDPVYECLACQICCQMLLLPNTLPSRPHVSFVLCTLPFTSPFPWLCGLGFCPKLYLSGSTTNIEKLGWYYLDIVHRCSWEVSEKKPILRTQWRDQTLQRRSPISDYILKGNVHTVCSYTVLLSRYDTTCPFGPPGLGGRLWYIQFYHTL